MKSCAVMKIAQTSNDPNRFGDSLQVPDIFPDKLRPTKPREKRLTDCLWQDGKNKLLTFRCPQFFGCFYQIRTQQESHNIHVPFSIILFSIRTIRQLTCDQASFFAEEEKKNSFLFSPPTPCEKKRLIAGYQAVKKFASHWGKKKLFSFLNSFQFATRGWPRTLDVTKPQEKRIASPPANFKYKHEVDFPFSAQKEDLLVNK